MGKNFNIYEAVTERILAQLEQGIIPWEKPWTGLRTGAFNRVTGKPYSILNQMMLKHEGEYASFKQWGDLGGKIKKGAKSEMVVFWKIMDVTETNDEGEEVKKKIPLLRYYNVFHISDVEGVEPKAGNMRKFASVKVADDLAESYVKREGISLNFVAGDNAFYRPSTDSVTLPLKEQFKNVAEFYSTMFHELIHSTGSKERCDRVGERTAEAFFGNEEYSKEELVAELGAAGILNDLGLETKRSIKNSAAYCQSWIRPLKNDKKFIVSASSRAEKAIKYLYGDFDFEQYSEDYEEPKAEKPKKKTATKKTVKKAETKKAEEPKAETKKTATKKTATKKTVKKTETKKAETVKAEPKKTATKKTTKKAEGGKTETKKAETAKPKTAKAETKKTATKKAEEKKTEKVKADKPKTEKSATKKTAVKAKAETAAQPKAEPKKTTRKTSKLTEAAKENIKGGVDFTVGGYKAAIKKGEIKKSDLPTLAEVKEDIYDGVCRNLYKDGKEIGKKGKELMERFTKTAIVAEIARLIAVDAKMFKAVA